MAIKKAGKVLKRILPNKVLAPVAFVPREWWTGCLVESGELIPGFDVVKGKSADTMGRDVCMIPEIRLFPDASVEKQFRVYYGDEDSEDGMITRSDYYRRKGFMPLDEAPEEIIKMAKKMKAYNKKKAREMLPGKVRYEVSPE